MGTFWKDVVSSESTTSSKRLITLLISLHFIAASFVILFLVCYVIAYLPKGKVDPVLVATLERVLEYDFYIIIAGLGFVTSEGWVSMVVGRAKTQAGAKIEQEAPEPEDLPRSIGGTEKPE